MIVVAVAGGIFLNVNVAVASDRHVRKGELLYQSDIENFDVFETKTIFQRAGEGTYMKIKFVSAFVSLIFVTSGCFLPTNALDGLLEYGPKHDWSDPHYEGIALKSDIPPNLSYLS